MLLLLLSVFASYLAPLCVCGNTAKRIYGTLFNKRSDKDVYNGLFQSSVTRFCIHCQKFQLMQSAGEFALTEQLKDPKRRTRVFLPFPLWMPYILRFAPRETTDSLASCIQFCVTTRSGVIDSTMEHTRPHTHPRVHVRLHTHTDNELDGLLPNMWFT